MTTRLARLTGPLVHDVGGVLIRLEEQELGMVEKSRGPVFPGLVALRKVKHDSTAVQKHCVVVSPLRLVVDCRAVGLVVSSIKYLVLVRDQADLLRPVVRFHSKICVGLVASVASETGTKGEGASVGDGVLVVVAVRVFGVDLPLQASTASSLVPAVHDVVEGVDRDFEV